LPNQWQVVEAFLLLIELPLKTTIEENKYIYYVIDLEDVKALNIPLTSGASPGDQ
jgi:hypothetical protein